MKAIATMTQAEGNDLYTILGTAHAANCYAGLMGAKWAKDEAAAKTLRGTVKGHNLFSGALAAGYLTQEGALTDAGLKAMWALEGCDENGNPV